MASLCLNELTQHFLNQDCGNINNINLELQWNILLWGHIQGKKKNYGRFRLSSSTKQVAIHCLNWCWHNASMMTSSNGNIFRVTGRSLVNSSHKAQQLQALMFSIIFAWIYGWVNNHEAGDLRCHHAHYDVTVMSLMHICIPGSSTLIKWDNSWRNVQVRCISPISGEVYE